MQHGPVGIDTSVPRHAVVIYLMQQKGEKKCHDRARVYSMLGKIDILFLICFYVQLKSIYYLLLGRIEELPCLMVLR